MNHKLKRPIVFFDLETTGVETTKDKIVEAAFTKINPDGTRQSWYSRFNPGIPIPEESSKVHGITNEDVEDQDNFKYLAPEILNFIEGCDLGGYNIEHFDIPILLQEFYNAGINWQWKNHTIVDVFKIYSVMEPRTLAGTYERFTGKTLENAHQAQADNEATIEIFEKQLEMYSNKLPENIEDYSTQIKYKTEKDKLDLAGKFIKEDNNVKFNFGKYRGKTVREVYNEDANYFMWMIDKGEFPTETKMYARKIHNTLSKVEMHK